MAIRTLELFFVTLLLISVTSTAHASGYRLDFSGLTVSTNVAYSGYLILDYTVADLQPGPMGGNYNGIVTDMSLQIGGVSFGMLSNGINLAQVIDNHVNAGDIFSITVQLHIPDGSFGALFIQFLDSGGSMFSGDSLPQSLVLSDYDPFVSTGNSTGAALPFIDGVTIIAMNPLTYAELRPVPLPGGLALFFGAMAILGGFKTRR